MTDVATPPPATERACPRCGAPLAPDQEWCLNCGTAVGTTIAPTPRWRLPVFLVGALLALVLAALVLALVELSNDPQPVAKAPTAAPPAGAPADDGGAGAPQPGTTVTPTPTPSPTTSPEPSATPGATTSPGPTSTPGDTTTAGGVASWPAGKTGWTVILASKTSRAQAESEARSAGGGAGVLHSDDFTSLRKGYWVVFQGQFDTRKAAETAAEGASGDAYARRVVPR